MVDMKGVDLNLLVSLDALLKAGNVSHAAAELGLSQSALSGQLAKLRRAFGDPLLVPADSGRGMVATARALELAPALSAALADIGALVRGPRAFDPQLDRRDFHVAASDNAVATLGLPLVERVSAHAGRGVRIAFHTPDAGTIAKQLESGSIDLLIGSERMVPPTMKARVLAQERFVMVQRKGHPRGMHPPDLDDYCALSHVLVSTSGGSFSGFMDEHLARLGRQRHVAVSLQHFTVVPEILRATDFVCTLPSRLAARFSRDLDAFDLPFSASGFALHMAWHPRHHHDSEVSWLRGCLLEVAALEPGMVPAVTSP